MTIVNLENLKPGMVLAEDARHLNGRILLSAGNVLTEKHLRMFKSWGLTEAAIEGVDREEIEQDSVSRLDPRAYKQAEEKMKYMFKHTDLDFEPVAELYRICVAEYAEQLTTGETA